MLALTSSSVDFQGPHHLEVLSLLFCGPHGVRTPLTLPHAAPGAAGGGVPRSAHGDLTLQIDHIVAAEKAEGVELELGHVLVRVKGDVGIVFDAADRKKSPRPKGLT